MNNTPVNVQSNVPTKHIFSKGTSVTLSVTLLIMAAAILGRAICAMIWSQRLSVYHALYQLFGTGSVPVVNIVIGALTACVLVFLAIGLFSARSGANSMPPVTAGLSFLKVGLIVSLVYTSLAVVTSFASVSVINRNDIEGYVGFINLSATGLFIFTLFLGIAAICCQAAMIRLCGAMTANLQSGTLVKKGAGLTFLGGVIGVVTAAVDFFIKLFHLVAPPKGYLESINADKATAGISNAEMLINVFNIVIFAAAVVIFVCLMILAGSYAIRCDDVIRAGRNGAYNIGHQTAFNPESVPDYATPQTYNYQQAQGFVPYYIGNQNYQNVNSNVYTGTVPPVPQAPENPFKPKTQYPSNIPAQNPAVNPVYPTTPAYGQAPANANPNPVPGQVPANAAPGQTAPQPNAVPLTKEDPRRS